MLVGQFGSFIGEFLKMWGDKPICEGDVFVTNDTYAIEGAVSHLNDVIVLLPIWFKGQLIGWAANFGRKYLQLQCPMTCQQRMTASCSLCPVTGSRHADTVALNTDLTDVQGKVPGSMSVNATTIFEDGLQIPCVKLYEKGRYNEAMVEIFRRNSRVPEWFDSDLTALVAACKTAAVRVGELCERYGYEVYRAATEDLLLRNKTAIANLIDNKVGTERSFFTVSGGSLNDRLAEYKPC